MGLYDNRSKMCLFTISEWLSSQLMQDLCLGFYVHFYEFYVHLGMHHVLGLLYLHINIISNIFIDRSLQHFSSILLSCVESSRV